MLSDLRTVVASSGWLVRLGAGLVGIVAFLWIAFGVLSHITEFTVEQRLTAVGILANVLLTLGLLGVYFKLFGEQRRQAGIQDQQKEILKKQEKWMEASHAPKLLGIVNTITGRDDVIRLDIENRGNGLASNINLGIEVRRPLDNPLVTITEGESIVHQFEPDDDLWTPPSFAFITPKIDITEPQGITLPSGSDGVVIGSDEERSLWVHISFFGFHDSEGISISPLSMGQLFQELANQEYDNVSVSLQLSYQDIAGENYNEQILDGVVDVEEGKTVKDVVSELL